ncbi:MAG: S1C family serine protease [Saccharofermentanales bacterium]
MENDNEKKDDNDLVDINPEEQPQTVENQEIQPVEVQEAQAAEVQEAQAAEVKETQAAEVKETQAGPEFKEPRRRRGGMAVLLICVILATSILTSAVSYGIFNYYGPKNASSSSLSSSESISTIISDTSSSASSTISTGDKKLLTIPEINKKVNPSVVFITVEVTGSGVFGQQQQTTGSGSGMIISKDGYILTNNHVIDGANKITVKLINNKEYPATLIGKDSKTDLAILKIAATDLTPVVFGDSSKVQVGDLAVAIGYPLGELEGTLTVGVISALNRSITIDNITMSLMQTDAAVNPGNSGCALINGYGEVIGIVNSKTSAVGIEGFGYAIPINETTKVIDDLMKKGYVTGRITMGISTRDITEELSTFYDLPVGIFIVSVLADSPADKAGIKANDVITGVDGKSVLTSAELGKIKDSHKVGDKIKILLVRDKKDVVVTLTFEEDKQAN